MNWQSLSDQPLPTSFAALALALFILLAFKVGITQAKQTRGTMEYVVSWNRERCAPRPINFHRLIVYAQ
jgi:hypothetical protein